MQSLARPWLGPYLSPDHQLLFPGTEGLGSVAILPLLRGDRLVGALNFGSADPKRFTRHHASDFLTHLSAIVGFAVESAGNRARLVRAGLTDFLTGWHNKRYLTLRLREELARARRQKSVVSLLMIDVDRFKEINDSYGHLGGDTAIREVAQRIESQVRSSDAAARFGGDEFAVLLPGTAMADARRLAERIMQAVGRAPMDVGNGMTRSITLSIGIGTLAPGTSDRDLKALADQLLAEADAALYRAKAAGRNCVECQP
jgi:diguanylate cyclase (GGDEF)-like protein